jgi:hypothetical protein
MKARAFGVTYCTPVDRVRAFLGLGMEQATRRHSAAPSDVDARGR